MIVAVIAFAVAGVLAGSIAVARSRARTARLVDQLSAELLGHASLPSTTPGEAVARLRRAVETTQAPELSDHDAQRYRAALASMTMGVIVVDSHAEPLYSNPFAAGFMDGRHGEAVVGQTIDELIGLAIDGEVGDREINLYGPPRRKLFLTANAIDDGHGFPLGAVVLIDDITEQERLDAIRRDFVANISHELRTPIGAVSLLAETLVGEDDPDVIAGLASRISTESERLARTIDDLLQLSRIEHGSDDEFEPVKLRNAIGAAHDRVRAAAEQRNVEIGVNLPQRDLVVRGDALQLTSAVYNLLDNAVKYIGPDGGVVSVRARAIRDQIEVVVQDSGIGIPRKDLDRVFERFYRVDRGRSRASGGTGLGLAIVRHVVANHGGRASVDSTEGEGTTFTLHLPALGGFVVPDDDPGEQPESPSDDGNGDHEVSTP